MLLTVNDKQYRYTCSKIGGTMLMFYLIFNVLCVGISLLQEYVMKIYPSDLLDMCLSLAYYASYMFAFMSPVLFYKLISKGHRLPDMHLEFKLTKKLWYIIPAAIGLSFTLALINTMWLMPINFSEYISPDVPGTYYAHDFILDVIGIAMVPAVCEEFLFRGLILSALLPYGKKTAIFGSAILFCLMHQNPAQILAPFALGIIFAYITIETGSIWGGIIIHFLNNLLTVVLSAIIYTVEPGKAEMIYSVIFYGVMLIGLVIVGVIVRNYIERRTKINIEPTVPEIEYNEIVESEPAPAENSQTIELSSGFAVKGFFAPTNLIFMIASVVNMALLIGMAILNYSGV